MVPIFEIYIRSRPAECQNITSAGKKQAKQRARLVPLWRNCILCQEWAIEVPLDFATCKLGLSLAGRIKCSNFIGQTLSDAISLGFRRVLLIGHIGKLVKLGAGIMNTHSAQADARMEILLSCALAGGASLEALQAVAASLTTEAALEALRRFDLLESAMEELEKRIENQLDRRFGRFLELGVLVFSGQKEAGEILCRCGRAEEFLEKWRGKA